VTRNVATVDPGADVADAATTMMKGHVRRLPGVDVHGCVHGLVALDDLVRNVARHADETSEVVFSQLLTPSLEP
jgi:CBS domain-containing protein